MVDPLTELKNHQPAKKFLIAIDSDGCAFDSMEIKHKECFIPNIVKYWNLQPISKYARRAAEFVLEMARHQPLPCSYTYV